MKPKARKRRRRPSPRFESEIACGVASWLLVVVIFTALHRQKILDEEARDRILDIVLEAASVFEVPRSSQRVYEIALDLLEELEFIAQQPGSEEPPTVQ